MNKKTLQITTGAMMIAVFGVLMLLNRQTGSLLQDIFSYIFPIPMLIYALRYGFKSSLPVYFCMVMLSVFFGTFTTIFYAASQTLIGLVFGSLIYKRVDMTKTLLIVMALSAVVCVLNTIVLASVFGNDLNREILEMQKIMDETFAKFNVEMPENFITFDFLRRMMIISMIFSGALQGFAIYEVSYLVLKKLRFPIEQPKSIYDHYPAKWTAYAGLVAFFGFNYSLALSTQGLAEGKENLITVLQTVGIIGYLYLVIFGFLGSMWYFLQRFPKRKLIICVLSFLAIFALPQFMVIAGFVYITMRQDPAKLPPKGPYKSSSGPFPKFR